MLWCGRKRGVRQIRRDVRLTVATAGTMTYLLRSDSEVKWRVEPHETQTYLRDVSLCIYYEYLMECIKNGRLDKRMNDRETPIV